MMELDTLMRVTYHFHNSLFPFPNTNARAFVFSDKTLGIAEISMFTKMIKPLENPIAYSPASCNQTSFISGTYHTKHIK